MKLIVGLLVLLSPTIVEAQWREISLSGTTPWRFLWERGGCTKEQADKLWRTILEDNGLNPDRQDFPANQQITIKRDCAGRLLEPSSPAPAPLVALEPGMSTLKSEEKPDETPSVEEDFNPIPQVGELKPNAWKVVTLVLLLPGITGLVALLVLGAWRTKKLKKETQGELAQARALTSKAEDRAEQLRKSLAQAQGKIHQREADHALALAKLAQYEKRGVVGEDDRVFPPVEIVSNWDQEFPFQLREDTQELRIGYVCPICRGWMLRQECEPHLLEDHPNEGRVVWKVIRGKRVV